MSHFSTNTISNASAVSAHLVPINLEDAEERELLRRQRVVCGWKSHLIDKFREQVQRKECVMYWITLPATMLNDVPRAPTEDMAAPWNNLVVTKDASTGRSTSSIAAGHISLDRLDFDGEPSDATLATGDGEVMTISRLFVLPAFREHGLGKQAMMECERVARQVPAADGLKACKALTINNISTRHMTDDFFDRMGQSELRPTKNQSLWYQGMGYVPYKEQVRHVFKGIDGGEVDLWASYMRKELC